MSRQANIEATERFGEAVNNKDYAVFAQVMAPGVQDNDPAPDQGPGPEGFVGFFKQLHAAFPDAKVEVAHMLADEDNVAIAYTLTGTHQGDFQGVAPTGKRIQIRGMQIARFEDGKMVERWGSSDELGILKQCGIDPTAG